MRKLWLIFCLSFLVACSNEMPQKEVVSSGPPCKLILLRHGQTDWNVAGKMQGWKDIPLNEKGRDQARDVAKELSSFAFKTIYSSSLSRAVETAQIIAESHEALIIPDPAIRFYRKDAKKKVWWKSKETKHLEMQQEIARDAVAYFKDVARKHPGEVIPVVTHSTVITSLRKTIGVQNEKPKRLGNGKVIYITATEDSVAVRDYNLWLED